MGSFDLPLKRWASVLFHRLRAPIHLFLAFCWRRALTVMGGEGITLHLVERDDQAGSFNGNRTGKGEAGG